MAKSKGRRTPRYERDMRASSPVKEPVTIDSGQDAHSATLGGARREMGRRRAPNGKFLIPVAVGALGGAAYLAHRHHRRNDVNKFYDPFTDEVVEFEKKDNSGPSAGRRLTASIGGPIHPLVAGKKGQKARGAASWLGYGLGGNIAGNIVGGAAGRAIGGARGRVIGGSIGSFVGGTAGVQRAVGQNHRKGRLKQDKGFNLHKAVSPMYGAKNAFADQPTNKVGALLPTGKHVSHENKLQRFTPLGGYRRATGKDAQKLLRVTGSDRAAKEYKGKLVVAHKSFLGHDDVDRMDTYGRQVTRRGRRIA